MFVEENQQNTPSSNKGQKRGRSPASGAKGSSDGGSSLKKKKTSFGASQKIQPDIETVLNEIQPALEEHIKETKANQEEMCNKLDKLVDQMQNLPANLAVALAQLLNKQ